MAAWPGVSILIPTYNRAPLVRRTVDLLRRNLKYSGNLQFYIGCDGDDDTPRKFSEPDVHVLAPASGSLGANLNRLIAATSDDFLLSLDDDHWLENPIHLEPHVDQLRDAQCGWIHLLVDAVGDESNDGYKFTGRLHGKYWWLDYGSLDEWPCSFRAHLSHKRFHNAVGAFAEGLPTGRTELEFNQRAKRLGVDGQLPSVLVPLCAYGYAYWAHVGQSFNRRGL